MTIAQALATAAAIGIERLDAQMLLLHVLGRPAHDRAWLIAHDGDPVAAHAESAFLSACERRRSGEPVAYIVGKKEFFGLDLQVDARVLVPRPDTETLVAWGLEVAGTLAHVVSLRIVDLGTGSGAIALALRSALPHAEVDAIDASEDALEVARANATRLGLAITCRRAEWLQGAGSFHLIVSNPPYVADDDPHLPALRHEPLSALASGVDGLDDIRRIVSEAPLHLEAGGWLLLEHGHDQAAAVQGLLAARGFTEVQSRKDLAGIARCTGGRWLELG